MSWSMFAHLAQVLAPVIITSINPKLAPIAGAVSNGIAEAEQIPKATGPEKLQHVLNIANEATSSVNSAAGKALVNPKDLATATETINTVVSILNTAHPVAVSNLSK